MTNDPLLGRKVGGRFTIERLLGEGGMAKVYIATQDGEPREVALKIMNEDLMDDRTFMRRFEREAKAAARVQHANSVRIIAYGVEDRVSYIAMELVVGDDLFVLLERGGALSQARAVRILVEVCDALAVAHEIGIVHRDLKPENIMVVADASYPSGERVKVLDFGIAKLIAADAIAEDGRAHGGDPSSSVTRAGTFIGTPAYMSPEQCALLAVDTRADIYTCGVLLFQLLTCRLPFEGETPLHTATLHIHTPPPRPSSYAPAIDARLEQVIMKALAKRPSERHQTARHLASTLRKILPELPDVQVATGPATKRGLFRRPASISVASSKLKSTVGAASAPDSPIESARTMVAEGILGPPPAVVLRDEPPVVPTSDPPTRVKPDDDSDSTTAPGIDPGSDPQERAATLVRPPTANKDSDSDPARRFGPSHTEVIAQAQDPAVRRDLKQTLKSAEAFLPKPPQSPQPAPAAPRAQPASEPRPSAVDELAATPPHGPPMPPAKEASPHPVAVSPLKQIVHTLPLAAARVMVSPAAPPAMATLDPATTPMLRTPQVHTLPMAERVAPTQRFVDTRKSAKLSGGSGLVIGFLAGLTVMAIFAVVYLFVLKR